MKKDLNNDINVNDNTDEKANKKTKRKTRKKSRRKIKKSKIIIPIIIAVVVIIFVVNKLIPKDMTVMVYTDSVKRGDIRSTLSTSGTVTAENTVTYFAPAGGKIAGVEAEAGDVVKKGDMLVCFDEEAVVYAQKQSELESKISTADYNATVKDYNENQAKLAQANADIAAYEAMIDNYETYIDDLSNGITDMTALRKSDLYAKIYSIEKAINNYDLAMQTPSEDTDMEDILRRKTEKQNELIKYQNDLNLLSDYKTDYGWEDLLTQAKKDLADAQEKLQEAKNNKSSAEAGISNKNKLSSYELNQEKSQLTSEDEQKKYETALNGIIAEFDGVVTQLTATEGATVQEGTQLLVLESYKNICVKFQASKYDLEVLKLGQPVTITISGNEYNGTVTKINKMATPNSSGAPMVEARVHIDNPDNNIFLGIEARLSVTTADLKDVLLAPVEAVNVDNGGDFCYCVKDGVLAKKYVATGVSSESMIEIVSGLDEGEEIVSSSYMGMDIAEGMPVTVMPQMGAALNNTDNSDESTDDTESEQAAGTNEENADSAQ